MDDKEKRSANLKATETKADQKVRDQEDLVRGLNGTAKDRPEEQRLLDEMRANKATLDINRAMREYDDQEDQRIKKS